MGDPSELDEPGQVTHQSLSFAVCAGDFSIYFTLIKCMEACEGLIRALVPSFSPILIVNGVPFMFFSTLNKGQWEIATKLCT